MASFQNRVIGALTLQASTYEEVENDASATSQAAIIVVAAALLGSLGSLIYGFGMAVILGPIFALIGWVIGSFVVMFVGTSCCQARTPAPTSARCCGLSASRSRPGSSTS